MTDERDRPRPLPPPRVRRPGPRAAPSNAPPTRLDPVASTPTAQASEASTTLAGEATTPEELEATAALAYSLYEAERYEDARRIFEGLIALEPSNAYAHRGAAAARLAMGDGPGALAGLDEALKRVRERRGIHVLRAQALFFVGDTMRARAALEEALRSRNAEVGASEDDPSELELVRALLASLDGA